MWPMAFCWNIGLNTRVKAGVAVASVRKRTVAGFTQCRPRLRIGKTIDAVGDDVPVHQRRDPRQILIRDGLAGGPSELRAASWVVLNVIPRVRPSVCCVKPGRLERFIACNPGARKGFTQQISTKGRERRFSCRKLR
jgi:hypothetical protein